MEFHPSNHQIHHALRCKKKPIVGSDLILIQCLELLPGDVGQLSVVGVFGVVVEDEDGLLQQSPRLAQLLLLAQRHEGRCELVGSQTLWQQIWLLT